MPLYMFDWAGFKGHQLYANHPNNKLPMHLVLS
uniref:Transposase n=1 Tax=Heterorhabditis bacteriophora TaxID=37862 RepID=A0A1I7WXE7_HETBA